MNAKSIQILIFLCFIFLNGIFCQDSPIVKGKLSIQEARLQAIEKARLAKSKKGTSKQSTSPIVINSLNFTTPVSDIQEDSNEVVSNENTNSNQIEKEEINSVEKSIENNEPAQKDDYKSAIVVDSLERKAINNNISSANNSEIITQVEKEKYALAEIQSKQVEIEKERIALEKQRLAAEAKRKAERKRRAQEELAAIEQHQKEIDALKAAQREKLAKKENERAALAAKELQAEQDKLLRIQKEKEAIETQKLKIEKEKRFAEEQRKKKESEEAAALAEVKRKQEEMEALKLKAELELAEAEKLAKEKEAIAQKIALEKETKLAEEKRKEEIALEAKLEAERIAAAKAEKEKLLAKEALEAEKATLLAIEAEKLAKTKNEEEAMAELAADKIAIKEQEEQSAQKSKVLDQPSEKAEAIDKPDDESSMVVLPVMVAENKAEKETYVEGNIDITTETSMEEDSLSKLELQKKELEALEMMRDKELSASGKHANAVVVHDPFTFKVDSYKGAIVVMNFWFAECKNCIQEIPELNKLVEKYGDQNVKFLGMSTDMPETAMEATRANNFKYEIVPMSSDRARERMVFFYPSHIVLDRNGKQIASFTGNSTDVMTQLEATIEKEILGY